MAKSYYFCGECQRYLQFEGNVPEPVSCAICKTVMIKTRKPRDITPNHTQFLHYMFEFFLTGQIVFIKQMIDLNLYSGIKEDQSAMKLMRGQLHSLNLTRERLQHFDDLISELRRYPQLKEMFFSSIENDVTMKDFLMEKFPSLAFPV